MIKVNTEAREAIERMNRRRALRREPIKQQLYEIARTYVPDDDWPMLKTEIWKLNAAELSQTFAAFSQTEEFIRRLEILGRKKIRRGGNR